jgi:type IV secretion system protein VirB11
MRYEPIEQVADPLGRDTLVKELMKPLAPFLMEEGATEISINRPGEVFVEIGAEWRRFDAPELTLDVLMQLATAIATFTEQEIGPQRPILSAMLPGMERVQIIVPPAVEAGSIAYAIRIPSADVKSLDQYEAEGAFARYVWGMPKGLEARIADVTPLDRRLIGFLQENRLKDFFRAAVLAKKNIAVVGDTGSGKTTLMKSVCQSIPTHERLITIEDVRELFLPLHDNRVHLLYSKGGQGVARITPADLIAANMRLKPNRVLLAELRGGEAFDFLKLLTTGHSGSLTSFHAESCALAAERFVLMCREHEQAAIYDADALKRLFALTIDIVVHVIAESIYDDSGNPVRKERYVTEVHYDPIAKLVARFGDATLHHAEAG